MRGIYCDEPVADADLLVTRATAALNLCPPGSLATGITALAIKGIDIPDGMDANGPIQMAVPRTANRFPRRPELRVHIERTIPSRWSPQAATADPVHCWARACLEHIGADPWLPGSDGIPAVPGSFEHQAKRAFLAAVQLGDALMRRQRPVLSQSAFARGVAAWGPRKGANLLRQLFRHIRQGTDSLTETWLRLCVVDAGFPEPLVNYCVRVGDNRRYLDLSWPDLRIALEYHGRQHFNDPGQSYSDVYRRGRLQVAGWLIIEATYQDLVQPVGMIERLSHAFARVSRSP
jgi:hypothetical protein